MELESEVIGYPEANVTVEEIPKIIGLSAVDHLVLIAVLLISLGVAVNNTFSKNGSGSPSKSTSRSFLKLPENPENISSDDDITDETLENNTNSLTTDQSDITSTTLMQCVLPSFINSLSLFSLSGEIYEYDISILFFFFGIFISIVLLFFSGILNIFKTSEVGSISSYLRKRYNNKAASYLVVTSAIIRHIFGGTLSVYVVGMATSSAAGLPKLVLSFGMIIISAIGVTIGGIQPERAYKVGRLWLAILCTTTFITLCMSTSYAGGVGALITKANEIGKLNGPRVSLQLWERHSYWSLTVFGIMFGIQIFFLPRTSLKHLKILPITKYYIGLLLATFVMLAWAFLASWAGICSAVTFSTLIENKSPVIRKMPIPEGSLLVLISFQMHRVIGFRGFFIGALLTASISGLMRRFNEVISVLWEVTNASMNTPSKWSTSSLLQLNKARELPEDLAKEMDWLRNHRLNCISFAFKAISGLASAAICSGIIWLFHYGSTGSWELWQGLIGVVCGSVIGAIILGAYFPCFPHMSVVIGLLVGWCIPCYLALANINQDFLFSNKYQSNDAAAFTTSVGPEIPLFKDGFNFSGGFHSRAFNEEFFKQQNEWVVSGNTIIQVKDSEIPRDPTLVRPSRIRKRQLVDTSYCYYGFIGTICCLVTALIFTVATKRTVALSIGALFSGLWEPEKNPNHVYSNWDLLPNLLLENICQYLTVREKYYVAQVCSTWRQSFYFPRVWYTFIFHDGLLTKRKYNYYAGWEKILDHYRASMFLNEKGEFIRTLIIKPMTNLFNLYEFLNIAYFMNLKYPKILGRVHTLRFQFGCHMAQRSEDLVFGTGGQLLSMIKRVLGVLSNLRTLELIDFLLEGSEGLELLDEVCLLCCETLRTLILINLTKHHHSILHPGAFVNLQVLIISPQILSEDLLELLSNNQLSNLHIVQNLYTEHGYIVHWRAWRKLRKNSPKMRVHLRTIDNAKKSIVWQPAAPVKTVLYDSRYIEMTTAIAVKIAELYSSTLEVFGHKQVPRFHMAKSFHSRIDSSLVLLVRQCPYLHTLMVRERVSSATILLLAYTGKNLVNLYVRRNGIILRADWPRSPDWSSEFYKWLCKSSQSYESLEKEVSQILGLNWKPLADKQYRMVDLPLDKDYYMQRC